MFCYTVLKLDRLVLPTKQCINIMLDKCDIYMATHAGRDQPHTLHLIELRINIRSRINATDIYFKSGFMIYSSKIPTLLSSNNVLAFAFDTLWIIH